MKDKEHFWTDISPLVTISSLGDGIDSDIKWKKYRKKPVIIEAYQTDIERPITTLEGTMIASPGDFIIRGVIGEIYPCKPDVFEKTYEPVGDSDE